MRTIGGGLAFEQHHAAPRAGAALSVASVAREPRECLLQTLVERRVRDPGAVDHVDGESNIVWGVRRGTAGLNGSAAA